MNLKYAILFIFLLESGIDLPAQTDIAFQQVNTLQGLSNNSVVTAMEDEGGYVWIATQEGLNGFDGRKIQTYFREQYPELGNNNIREMVADNQNRLWIRSFGGYISVLNNQRRFQSIKITHADTAVPIYNLVKTKSRGVVLFRGGLHFTSGDSLNLSFKHWPFTGDSLFNTRLGYISYLDEDRVIFIGINRLFIMDYRLGKITTNLLIPGIMSAAPIDSGNLLLIVKNKGLMTLNLNKPEPEPICCLKDEQGRPMSVNLNIVRKMADGRFIIGADYDGIYLLNLKTGNLKAYRHDPLNDRSLISGTINHIACYPSGQVYITSSSGLCFFNVFNKQAHYLPHFVVEKEKQILDGYVNAIIPDRNNQYWVGVYNQLIRWNKQTGQSTIYEFGRMPNGEAARGKGEVTSLCKDAQGRLWVGTASNGLCVLAQNGQLIRQWMYDSTNKSPIPSNRVNGIVCIGQSVWVASDKGLCRFNTSNLQPHPFYDEPNLKPMQTLETSAVWFSGNGQLWVGERHGSWRYNFETKQLKQITRQTGPYSIYIRSFNEDLQGRVYIGGRYGLTVLDGDSILHHYSRGKGLRSDHCQNILRDGRGHIWIDNNRCIIRYSPANGHFTYFSEKSGISAHGLRVGATCKDDNGFLFFGSEKGLNWFHPDSIVPPAPALKFRVSGIQVADTVYTFSGGSLSEMGPGNFSIRFSAISLTNPREIQFRYQLVGYDDHVLTQQDIESVQYSKLKPGGYQFMASATDDGEHWVSLPEPIKITVKAGFFGSWQFRVVAAFLLATLIFLTFKRREYLIHKQSRRKASEARQRALELQYQLESEQVITYFATSLNGVHNVDDVLWDVAKNCISKLGFQDCVIYGWDAENNMLIQKAAYGPKNLDYRQIFNPIALQMGKGIVGSVALNRRPELIADTSADVRYITDDAFRLSELAVPIVSGERLWGVIDSEHPTAGFYKLRHLQILTSIATLVANKLEQVSAETAIREKEMEMARLQRDMATSQLTSTRAQMNPHFIFNALNSIQQFILQGNTDEANRYLSRFSRLQREILNHCNQPFISLKKEMEMLTIYLQLEQLRFDGTFEFALKPEPEMDPEEIMLPPMILQPFVENSIWHGLMPLKGKRQVLIQFNQISEDQLVCIIEDNGIGRTAAAAFKKEQPLAENHESKGLNLVYERLELLKKQFQKPFSATITDLMDETGNASGTRVTVILFTGHSIH